jgi:hypothetical protein
MMRTSPSKQQDKHKQKQQDKGLDKARAKLLDWLASR